MVVTVAVGKSVVADAVVVIVGVTAAVGKSAVVAAIVDLLMLLLLFS